MMAATQSLQYICPLASSGRSLTQMQLYPRDAGGSTVQILIPRCVDQLHRSSWFAAHRSVREDVSDVCG